MIILQMRKQLDATNAISIQFRGGDAVMNPEYRGWNAGVVTNRYYRNAIDCIRARAAHSHLYVLSDDIPWIKQDVVTDGTAIYVDRNGPEQGYEDLHLMRHCLHNIPPASAHSAGGPSTRTEIRIRSRCAPVA
ncbi:alpha-1,2-fucosyltransferase [Noviherbaspirillum denitrificans]|uniref:alpha-1,2-fucosyltransferase n=1 Tax=Noviherbaspirillum denitrificans TaxID=1968433 RepID=UPI000B5296C2|nr:alpha-1,2-fucosyltransferase [Noviherbaspirillum denitrificans]